VQNNRLVLNSNASFELAIKLLDQNGNGVLPVVDDNEKFIGLITDGDIRKAILNKELDLEHIVNRDAFTLSVKSSKMQRIQYLKGIKRRQLPLVDDENKFIALFTLDEIEFNKKPNVVVIMVGGLGARLGELTKDVPKPMLHVGEKPILEIIIEKFIEFGFNRFYLAVNHRKEIIKEYFKEGRKWGVDITYLEENKRLGTGGALSLIDEVINEPIIVTNGDVLTNIDFDELLSFHKAKDSEATMCVREYEHVIPYGVIETNVDKILGVSEKPKMKFNINTGVYVLNPNLLNVIPKNQYYDLPSLFSELIEKGVFPFCYKMVDYWIDIGRKDEYVKVNDDHVKNII
jgi:dTDP-glucose pyrophosphorylase